MAASSDQNVKVAVRVRPFNSREKGLETTCVVSMQGQTTILTDPNNGSEKPFVFDHSLWSMDRDHENFADQEYVFEHLGLGVLDNAFEGYNACVFAYGQTGSGKTHTMIGYPGDNEEGLIPRLCNKLFERISEMETEDLTFRTEVSYMEIYNEKVFDLLSKEGLKAAMRKPLRVREHKILGPYVDGLQKLAVTDFKAIDVLMSEGNKSRTTGSTKMNDTSSRSHAVFTLHVTQSQYDHATKETGEKTSRISLVDLAGSERQSKTGAAGARLQEGANINKSLTTLGLVIAALAEGPKKQKFVPYRDSVLTFLLKDSLGGNSKTVMVAAISPAADSFEETLSTLRFADRAKQIKTHAVVNEDPKARLIRELREELEQLRAQASGRPSVDEQEVQDLRSKLAETEGFIKELTQTWEEKLKATEAVIAEKQAILDHHGASVFSEPHALIVNSRLPHFVAMSDDPLAHDIQLYTFKEGVTTIGGDQSPDAHSEDEEEQEEERQEGGEIEGDAENGSENGGRSVPKIVEPRLNGHKKAHKRGGENYSFVPGLSPKHCQVHHKVEMDESGGHLVERVTLVPVDPAAAVCVDSQPITEPKDLQHGSLVRLGSQTFRFNHPTAAQLLRKAMSDGKLEDRISRRASETNLQLLLSPQHEALEKQREDTARLDEQKTRVIARQWQLLVEAESLRREKEQLAARSSDELTELQREYEGRLVEQSEEHKQALRELEESVRLQAERDAAEAARAEGDKVRAEVQQEFELQCAELRTEVEALQAKVGELTAGTEKLKQEHEENLQAAAASKQAEVAQVKQFVTAEFEVQLAAAREELEAAKQEHAATQASLSARVASLEAEKEQLQASASGDLEGLRAKHAEALQAAEASKEAEVARVRQELTAEHEAQLATVREELQASVEQHKTALAASEQQLSALLEEQAALKAQLEQQRQEHEVALKETVAKLEAEHFAALERQQASTERDLEACRTELKELHQSALGELRLAKEQELRTALEELSSKHETALREQEARLQAEASEQQAQAVADAKTQAAQEGDARVAAVEAAAAEQRGTADTEVQTLREDRDAQAAQVSTLGAQVVELQAKLEDNTKARTELEERLDALQRDSGAELAQQVEDAKRLREELQEALDAKTVLEARASAAEQEAVQAQQALQEARIEHEAADERAKSELEALRSQLEQEHAETRAKLGEAEAACVDSRAEATASQEALERVKQAHAVELAAATSAGETGTQLAVEAARATAREQADALKAELDKSLEAKEQQVSKLRSECEQLRQQLSEEAAKREAAQAATLDAMASEHGEALQKARDLATEQLDAERTRLAQQHDATLDALRNELEAKHAAAVQELRSAHEHELSQQQLQLAAESAEALKAEVASALTEAETTTNAKIESLEAELETAAGEMATFRESLQGLQETLVEEQRAEMERVLLEKEEEMQSLVAQLRAQHEAEMAALRTQLTTEAEAAAALEASRQQVAATKDKLQQAQRELEERSNVVVQVKGDLEAAKTEHKIALEHSMEALQMMEARRDADLARMAEERKGKEAELMGYIQELEAQLAAAQEEVAAAAKAEPAAPAEESITVAEHDKQMEELRQEQDRRLALLRTELDASHQKRLSAAFEAAEKEKKQALEVERQRRDSDAQMRMRARADPSKPTLWVPDDAISQCQLCGTLFTRVRRKHHCRRCGKCICSACSPEKGWKPIHEYKMWKPVRHCAECSQSRAVTASAGSPSKQEVAMSSH